MYIADRIVQCRLGRLRLGAKKAIHDVTTAPSRSERGVAVGNDMDYEIVCNEGCLPQAYRSRALTAAS